MDGSGTNMCKAVNIEGCAVKATFCSMVCVGDSDDSDTEGGLGNVERVVMRPPGHSGKAKQGHLCFDASFETGNLGRVDFITENEYDLFIRPDTSNPRVRFWFHFSVENVRKKQRIIFNVVNLSKSRNLFQQGMAPVVRSTNRPKWLRLPSSQVYYYRSPEHSNKVVLSFAFVFDNEEESFYFALTFPYSYTRCMTVLRRIANDYPDIVTMKSHCQTISKRDLPVIEICQTTSSTAFTSIATATTTTTTTTTTTITTASTATSIANVMTEEDSQSRTNDDLAEAGTQPQIGPSEMKRHSIAILGRTHAGDSSISFVMQGILEFLSSSHKIAQDLREHLDFHIFPMLNPDGVFLGNARTTLLGMDLNRCWNLDNPYIVETQTIKKYILQLSENSTLDFIMDFFGNTTLTGMFVQGNASDSVYRFERHIVLPKLMAQNCPDFETANVMYNDDPEKAGTARRFFWSTIGGETNVYSVEVSQHGFSLEDGTIQPYSEEDYLIHGRRIMRSLWEYYKVTGVIKNNISALELSGRTDACSESTKELGFSLIRLRNISEQRQIFSSLESLSSDSSLGSNKDDLTKEAVLHSKTDLKDDDNGSSECNQRLMFNENIRLRDISSWKEDYERNEGLDSHRICPKSNTSRMLSEDFRVTHVPRLAVIGKPLTTGHESSDLAFSPENGPNMEQIERESLRPNSRTGMQSNMGPQDGFMQISSLGVGKGTDSLTVPSEEYNLNLGQLQYKSVGGGGKVVTTFKGSNFKKPTTPTENRAHHLDIYIKPISLQKAERTDMVQAEQKPVLNRKRSKKRKKPSSKAFHPDIIVSDTQ
ncbi:cytosolic carboxypeptidase 6-like [Tigriopus californicus]|uniref:cytosolic carboxypeptidase 6-like n=1 Tax=Tigriopus californicus TaxID=6832 RepID=UPI0027DA365E|nr:cytosolic carboxypeptidase 6-like [Tigriopus californicus]